MRGVQEPRFCHYPKAVSSDADDCAELASAYGLTPDEWQRNVLEAWMGRKKNGRWAAGRWGIAVPRQNGKNGIIEMVELFFMAVLGLKILHTAHEVKTARKAFIRIAGFFENERKYPELAELVKEIRRTNGQEAIVLHEPDCPRVGVKGNAKCCSGGSVEFIARSKGSGRGFTVDVLVLDEAQEYSEDAQAALLPTISSAPSGDPLQIMLGTPPSPGMDGDVFTRTRNAGVLGKDRRLAWVEWSASEDVNPGDRKVWAQMNPSLGIRLNESTVVDEYASMSREMFMRERLGFWDSMGGSKAVDSAAWDALRGTGEQLEVSGRRVIAVRFTADGSQVAVAGAVRPADADAPILVEAIEQRATSEGTQWIVEFLERRAKDLAQIVIDGKSGAGFLVNALRNAGVRNKHLILTPGMDGVVAASSMMEAAIRDGGLVHSGQSALDKQVYTAQRRKIGSAGGFGWQAAEGLSVASFEAVTLAFWGARVTRRNPSRKAVFV